MTNRQKRTHEHSANLHTKNPTEKVLLEPLSLRPNCAALAALLYTILFVLDLCVPFPQPVNLKTEQKPIHMASKVHQCVCQSAIHHKFPNSSHLRCITADGLDYHLENALSILQSKANLSTGLDSFCKSFMSDSHMPL